MDLKTIQKLEFNKILFQLAELTGSKAGREKALQLKPVNDLAIVEKRLDETDEAMEILRFEEPSFLNQLPVIDSCLAKARIQGILKPEELRDILLVLLACRQALRLADEERFPQLTRLVEGLFYDRDLKQLISRSVDEEGFLKDDASPQLKSVRGQINRLRLRIRDYLQDFIRSGNNQKMLQDALVTERDGRYVVPVKQEYRYEVKGIVHDESASGATVFIEPLAVVENNNQIRILQQEEKREVERILRELTARVAVYKEELAQNSEILAEMDLIFARARLTYKMDAYRPRVNNLGIIELNRARHPLLGEKAVPVNVELGKGFDMLVITGPNTGGKTVVLKTIGLLTLMAMSGLFIPAREKSEVAVFNNIYVDIGDEQSIEQSLSTFSSHMSNIINVIQEADKGSLVLLDELGAGTDPVEGAALARVILEELLARQCRAVVTTHQSELKNFAYQQERVENACVEFDPVSLKPTYELTIGMPGQSNAFEIALRLGMGPDLVGRARHLVPEQEMELGNMIKQLKERSYQFEESRREVEKLKMQLIQEQNQLTQERRQVDKDKREVIDRAIDEAERYVRMVRKEADEALQEVKDLRKDKDRPPQWHEIEKKRRKIKELRVENPWAEQLSLPQKREIKPGDYVLIHNINQKGYVVEEPDSQGGVVVQVGIMRLNVKADQLILAQSPEEKKIYRSNQGLLEKARNISKEIDVRGKLAEEALYEIDRYLEDANLVGLDSVRIIHGKGTGALRKAVRSYLKDHRYVKSYNDGARQEGGFGVTVVKLK